MKTHPLCARCKIRPVRANKSLKRNRLYVGKFCEVCAENQHSVRCGLYNKRRKAKAEAAGLCNRCWAVPAISDLKYCVRCQESDSKKAKEYNSRNRQLCLEHYGRKCSCLGCNISLEGFLTIHHIGGWGRDHKMPNGIRRAGASLYRWLVANNFPEGFATLCYNCNCAQEYIGYCPHELKTRITVAPQEHILETFPLEWQKRFVRGFVEVH